MLRFKTIYDVEVTYSWPPLVAHETLDGFRDEVLGRCLAAYKCNVSHPA